MKTKAMKTRTAATLILAAGVVGAIPSLAHADLITVNAQENGGAIVTIGSGSSILAFSGTTPNWDVSGTATGTPPEPSGTLDSNTIDVHATGPLASPLTVWITESGITSPLGIVPFLSSLTSNLLQNGVTSVTLTTFVNPGDNIPPPTILANQLDTATFTASDQTQTSIKNSLPLGPGPYSITEEYQISSPVGGTANLTIDVSTVPEPASIAIFGAALLGLGALRGWRRRKNA